MCDKEIYEFYIIIWKEIFNMLSSILRPDVEVYKFFKLFKIYILYIINRHIVCDVEIY